ncbi:MAG: Hsp20 family protein [Acidobacteria bacterium]|nr:Hsp20 family protein [Acidobacteriota bacterium]
MPEQAIAVEQPKKAAAPAPLKLLKASDIFEHIEKLHEEITRRAFEIFEHAGHVQGHDLEHWLQAESELLHPAHIEVIEKDGQVTVRAETPGFSAKDLEVSLDGRRLTISGKRESKEEAKDGSKTLYTECCSDELLRVIDLPEDVNAEKATASLKDGLLEIALPKAAAAKKISMKSSAA